MSSKIIADIDAAVDALGPPLRCFYSIDVPPSLLREAAGEIAVEPVAGHAMFLPFDSLIVEPNEKLLPGTMLARNRERRIIGAYAAGIGWTWLAR